MFPVALCSVIFQLFVYFPMPAHFIHFADFDLALHRRILARAVAIKNDDDKRFLSVVFCCSFLIVLPPAREFLLPRRWHKAAAVIR